MGRERKGSVPYPITMVTKGTLGLTPQWVAVEDWKLYKSDNITQVTNPNKGNEHTTIPSSTSPISNTDLDRLPAQSAMLTQKTTPNAQNKCSSDCAKE